MTVTHKRTNFGMDTPYIFWKYEKVFLGTPSKWQNMAIYCHVNMSKYGNTFFCKTSLGQWREPVLFRGEGEIIVTGKTANGRTVGAVRGKDQVNCTVCGDAPWRHSKNPPNFPLPWHKIQKLPMQSVCQEIVVVLNLPLVQNSTEHNTKFFLQLRLILTLKSELSVSVCVFLSLCAYLSSRTLQTTKVAGAEVVRRKTESNRLDSGSITYLAIKGRNRCAEFFEFAVRISATV